MDEKFNFFLFSTIILILSIIAISCAPIINNLSEEFKNWKYLDCQLYIDFENSPKIELKDLDYYRYLKNLCRRQKVMYNLEYASLIFCTSLSFICFYLSFLLQLDIGKEFKNNTGLIGFISGIICFILSFVYICYSGYIFNNDIFSGQVCKDGLNNSNSIKRLFPNGAIYKWNKNKYINNIYEEDSGIYSNYVKYRDLGDNLYNYNKELLKFYEKSASNDPCWLEKITSLNSYQYPCDYIFQEPNKEIVNRNLYNKWIATLVLSCFIFIFNISLSFTGYSLFKYKEEGLETDNKANQNVKQFITNINPDEILIDKIKDLDDIQLAKIKNAQITKNIVDDNPITNKGADKNEISNNDVIEVNNDNNDIINNNINNIKDDNIIDINNNNLIDISNNVVNNNDLIFNGFTNTGDKIIKDNENNEIIEGDINDITNNGKDNEKKNKTEEISKTDNNINNEDLGDKDVNRNEVNNNDIDNKNIIDSIDDTPNDNKNIREINNNSVNADDITDNNNKNNNMNNLEINNNDDIINSININNQEKNNNIISINDIINNDVNMNGINNADNINNNNEYDINNDTIDNEDNTNDDNNKIENNNIDNNNTETIDNDINNTEDNNNNEDNKEIINTETINNEDDKDINNIADINNDANKSETINNEDDNDINNIEYINNDINDGINNENINIDNYKNDIKNNDETIDNDISDNDINNDNLKQ